MPPMDPLFVSIERLLMGANISLEFEVPPNAPWLAAELEEIYKSFPLRTGDVMVRVTAPNTI